MPDRTMREPLTEDERAKFERYAGEIFSRMGLDLNSPGGRDTPRRKASPGLQVKIDGPWGSFVLHDKSEKPAVFLAGGIGITPFLSIIRQAGRDQSPQHMYLFYSNRRPEDAAFLDLLSEATKRSPNFHLVATMTGMDKSQREWKGEIGSINKDMLKALALASGAELLPGRAIRDGCGNAPHADRNGSGQG